MTIIVAFNGVMAADSASVAGSRIFPSAHPKIVRTREGGLVGCCGLAEDCLAFTDWAVEGFPIDKRPALSRDEDGFRALHMRPDGSLEMWTSVHRSAPAHQPEYIGETTACNVACGAIAVGADAETAVAMAIKHTVWVGGPIQVERVGPAVVPGSIREVSKEELDQLWRPAVVSLPGSVSTGWLKS